MGIFYRDFHDFRDFQDFQGFAQRKLRLDKKAVFCSFFDSFFDQISTGQTTGVEKCKNMVKIRRKWSIPAKYGRHICRVRRVFVCLIHIPPGGDKTPETALYGLIG